MDISRRSALFGTVLGALTLSAATEGRAAPAGGVWPQDLELVTVTESSFVLTWFTASTPVAGIGDPRPLAVPSDAVVRFGTRPDRLDRVVRGSGDTAYHHVEVTGLQPGTTYFYSAESGGRTAVPRQIPRLDTAALSRLIGALRTGEIPTSAVGEHLAAVSTGSTDPAAPGSVTTIVRPPGGLVATIALSNDLHIGETRSGIITGDFPPPFSTRPGQEPYPLVTSRSLIADVRRRGAEQLIVSGDLTAEAEPADVATAYSTLLGFGPVRDGGTLTGPTVLPTRGNHDRPHTGDAHRACLPVTDGHFDCLVERFPIPRQTLYTADHAGLRLVGLDTTMLDQAGGTIDEAQFDRLEDVLRSDPTRPTVVFGHHPVTDAAADTALLGRDFVLDRGSATRLERLYAATPGVFLHHSGHTHRNFRSMSAVAPGVTFLEVGAVKEYPAGFALLRVYEGGFTTNFYPLTSPEALEWRQVSSRQSFGLQPAVCLGGPGDRTVAVHRPL